MTDKNTDEIQPPETLPEVVDRNGGSNLPATVEDVMLALSDRDWDGVESGHVKNTVSPQLPRLLFNAKSDGGFADELDADEKVHDINFVWLADTLTRAWWPLDFGVGDKKPACRSRDGVKPDPTSPAQAKDWTPPAKDINGEIPSQACAACPNSQWLDGQPPPCASSIEVLIYRIDARQLSVVRFGGLSVSPVKRYLGALDARIPNRPPIAYVTHCTLEPTKTDNGTFLVARFSVAGDIPRREAQPLIELREQKTKEWLELIDADLAEGRTADVAEEATAGKGEEPF